MINKFIDEISFFEALATIVRQSGLKQADIVRSANLGLQNEIKKAKQENDRFKEATLELVGPLDKSTLSRALRGIDLIGYFTLYRIGLGLGLDQETFEWLNSLREVEERVHHSTAAQRCVTLVKTGGVQQSSKIPDWVRA